LAGCVFQLVDVVHAPAMSYTSTWVGEHDPANVSHRFRLADSTSVPDRLLVSNCRSARCTCPVACRPALTSLFESKVLVGCAWSTYVSAVAVRFGAGSIVTG
jgi:hypothetical protein